MQIKFQAQNNAQFFLTLKKRVEDYFTTNNISKNANAFMVFKTILLLSTFFTIYVILVANIVTSGWLAALLCAVVGMFTAFIGFNISHDATHGAYSSNARVNKLLSYTFDMLGASSYMWGIAHNVIHHTFTNIPEHDDDLEPVFFVRLNDTKKRYKFHRYQHYYTTFFYTLVSLNWVTVKDFSKMFQKKILNYETKKIPTKEAVKIFVGKALYYFAFIGLPIITTDFTWWQVIIGFLILHAAEGLLLAIVFQLAHVVQNTSFPEPDATGTIENNWAVHQLYTTADFARKSKIATFFFGGLNYQVEHHLFPRICHVHYTKLSEIVKQTAEEFGIPYHDNKTMWDALKSHYRMLKHFGRYDKLSLVEA